MIKKKSALLLVVASLMMSGCGSTGGGDDNNSTGPSANGANSQKAIGSQNLSEDIKASLEKKSWNSLALDLDIYLYDTKKRVKSYPVTMDFKDGKVTALADCYIVTAKYRVKEDELSFTRVSSPKSDIDNPRCKEFKGAENAVSSFFSSNYIVNTSSENSVTFEATDIEAEVILKR